MPHKFLASSRVAWLGRFHQRAIAMNKKCKCSRIAADVYLWAAGLRHSILNCTAVSVFFRIGDIDWRLARCWRFLGSFLQFLCETMHWTPNSSSLQSRLSSSSPAQDQNGGRAKSKHTESEDKSKGKHIKTEISWEKTTQQVDLEKANRKHDLSLYFCFLCTYAPMWSMYS